MYPFIELYGDLFAKCSDFWDFTKDPVKMDSLTKEMQDGKRKMYAVSHENSFIAGCSISYVTEDLLRAKRGERAYISYVAVKPDCRGQGIGTYMLENLIQKAKNKGYTELTIMVDKDNITAKHLYRKLGFSEVLYKNDHQILLLKTLKYINTGIQ